MSVNEKTIYTNKQKQTNMKHTIKFTEEQIQVMLTTISAAVNGSEWSQKRADLLVHIVESVNKNVNKNN